MPAARKFAVRRRAVTVLSLAGLWMAALAAWSHPAAALKPIAVAPETERLDITVLEDVDVYEGRGDSLQVDTALGPDGGSGRMSVRAATAGTDPNWLVFALTNATDKPLERWLTAERYNVIGSGAVWPDLDARRIEAVTPSIGFVPERIRNERADVFRITLEPGQTITYVAELSSERVARVYLWKPLDYELKIRDRQLFNGIMLGLMGLLAIFLTVIFAANHKMIFPAAALVAWCVLTYLCVDFGFFHKLFQLRPEDNAVYRAASEAAIAASLVIFLHTFLRLALGHGLVRMLFAVWILAQLALVAVAVIDPRLAATFARGSFLLVGGAGALFILYLAFSGQDRALSLVPSWIIFLVWVFGAAVTLTGRLSGEIVVSGLVAGLVLVVLLIGFTVTQFAFRSREPLYGATPSESQLRSLAVDGAGCGVWEWNGRRGEIKAGPLVEMALGLQAGELNTKVEGFVKHLHPADHERFNLMLWSIQERAGGRIRSDFRMRHADSSYRWFELEASSMPGADPRALRCVGLLREVTDVKRAHERLLQDAVHDSLTGLPNQALFLDRLANTLLRAKSEAQLRPTVFFIDIDRFKNVNKALGLVVADSLLLTVARRLQRHLGPHDTIARIGGDQFAILLPAEQSARDIAALAERIRRSLRSPIKIADQEIVLTGSIGIAVHDRDERSPNDLMKEAEIAMYRAKRHGTDRIELFRPEMRGDHDDRLKTEDELRKALEKNQIKIFYQPVFYLPTEELAGFEAVLRWQHPKFGLISPESIAPAREDSDLAIKLGTFTLMRAAQEAARWQTELPRLDSPLFVSINVASRQLFRPDLVQEIRHIFSRAIVPKGTLRLEITEQVVMENPEQATEILDLLKDAGAELALDDFGVSYSSLAYLQRFPVDTIKIDKSIVEASGSGDHAGSAMIRSMVALAHELGKKIIAEGVEAEDDVRFLRSIGCDYAQGVFYSDPMPEHEVLRLLKVVQNNDRKLQPSRFFRSVAKKKKTAAKPNVPARIEKQKLAATAEDGSKRAVRPNSQKVAAPPALPNSTVRPRQRAQPPATANGRPAPNGPDRAGQGASPPRQDLPPSVVQRAQRTVETVTLAQRLAAETVPRGPLPSASAAPPGPPSRPLPQSPPLPAWAAPLTNPAGVRQASPAPRSPPTRAEPPIRAGSQTPPLPGRGPPGQPVAPFVPFPPSPAAPPAGGGGAPPWPPAPSGPAQTRPNVSALPPSIAESLRKLAGDPPRTGPPPRKKGGGGSGGA